MSDGQWLVLIALAALLVVGFVRMPALVKQEKEIRYAACIETGYGSEDCYAAVQGWFRIGMSQELARLAANARGWGGMFSEGRPDSINRTITASGVREQWVYRQAHGRDMKAKYLYFTDGFLTAIQD